MSGKFADFIKQCYGARQSVLVEVESAEQKLQSFCHSHRTALRLDSALAFSLSGKTTDLELLHHETTFKDHYIGPEATRSTSTLYEFKRYTISL
jgi:hypothetical protein